MSVVKQFLQRDDVRLMAWYGDINGMYQSFCKEAPSASYLLTNYLLSHDVAVDEIFSSLETIPRRAFTDIANLPYVEIPGRILSVGRGAFSGCVDLKVVHYSELSGITEIREQTFFNCAKLKKIDLPIKLESIGAESFYGCGQLKCIEIPDSVKTISKCAFSGCKKLNAVYFANPATLTSIGDFSFFNCASLERIDIPPTVTAIGYGAFMECRRLKEITLPEGIATIGYNSFGNCQGLTAVHIPQSVHRIEQSAFRNCSQLQDIYYDGTKDDWQRVKKGVGNEWLKIANMHFAK